MLNSSDIIEQYKNIFAIVEIDFSHRQRWGELDEAEKRPEVTRYNPEQFRPVIVILNADGKQVFKSFGGFKTPQEARLLGQYVVGKHYLDTKWKAFAAENSQ